ncbi:MAG: DUF2332 domain-containing protein [Roseinatronobacter sp.]
MTFVVHARAQAEACAALGSPFTARLLQLVADRISPGSDVSNRLLEWPEARLKSDAVALRLTGALHHLVLTQASPDLICLYETPQAFSDDQIWQRISASFEQHSVRILQFLDSAPQTNELRRSSVLIAAAHWLTHTYQMPLVLSELGSSAGLNLLWDNYRLSVNGQHFGPDEPVLTLTPHWSGSGPIDARPRILNRAGVDLNPLNAAQDEMRLLAYIWADQPDRLARTKSALRLAKKKSPKISAENAVDWLETRLSERLPQTVHFVYHTVTWQYFSEADRLRGEQVFKDAGKRASTDAPLVRFSMEQDASGPGAALQMHLWPDDQRMYFGRADFHGRWVDWHAPEHW